MTTININSEIAGTVWKIEKQAGEQVAAEEPVLILESMKMEIPVCAPKVGVITEILVAEEEMVSEGATLARIECQS